MSSVPSEEINLPKEACHGFLGFFYDFLSPFFFFFFFDLYLSVSKNSMYISTHLLITGPVGGSAEQPLLAPNGRALSQPTPHPSNRID